MFITLNVELVCRVFQFFPYNQMEAMVGQVNVLGQGKVGTTFNIYFYEQV